MSSKSLPFTESVSFSMVDLGMVAADSFMAISWPNHFLMSNACHSHKHDALLLTTSSLLGSNLVSLEAKPSGFHSSQIQVSEEIALLPLLHGTVHYHA
jgi:hypothetical protein